MTSSKPEQAASAARYTDEFAHALDFVKRINALSLGGRPLAAHFQYDGMDFWQAYQMSIFTQARRVSKSTGPSRSALPSAGKATLVTLSAFLWSLAGAVIARATGRSVLVYSKDVKPQGIARCDFRLAELYAALEETQTPFIEIFHSTLDRASFNNLKTRKRPSLYLPGLALFARRASGMPVIALDEIDLGSFAPEERALVQSILGAVADDFARMPSRIAILSRVMHFMRVKKLFLIDDAYHYFDLLAAAKRNGIPSIAIQHGHFTKYHVGVLSHSVPLPGQAIVPDTLVVWSDYWKSELERLGSVIPPSHIRIGGVKDSLPSALPAAENSRLCVLVPYEASAPGEAMRAFIKRIQTCSAEVIFKPRSDTQLATQLSTYGLDPGDPDVSIETDAMQALTRANVVVGCYTTFLYDAVLAGRPVGQLASIMDYGEGMVKNGIADPLISSDSMCEELTRLAQTSPETLLARKERVSGQANLRLRDSIVTMLLK